MLQIRYCFTLRLHSEFRISIVSVSVSLFYFILFHFFFFFLSCLFLLFLASELAFISALSVAKREIFKKPASGSDNHRLQCEQREA